MRVTFQRLPDHRWGHVLIERNDHVVYRMHGGPITSAIPHDLVHLTVEHTMGISDGIWGAIAGGIVWNSMTHVSGRRPPHSADKSAELKRMYRDRIGFAELLGGFVETAAHRPDTDFPQLVKDWFSVAPVDDAFVARAAKAVVALRRAEEQWRALPIGGEVVVEWPAHRRIAPPASRQSRQRTRTRTR